MQTRHCIVLLTLFSIFVIGSTGSVALTPPMDIALSSHDPQLGLDIEYTVIDPINIKSEADLANYSFPGDGTENNPYIIENYKIESLGFSNDTYSSVRNAIDISSVSAHFVIQNTYLYGGDADVSIYINSLTNGSIAIRDNIIESIGTGIQIWHTEAIITGNNITNSGSGITIRANNSQIESNTIHGCEFSCIDVDGSNISVHNNLISSGDEGIEINDARDIVVTNNTIDSSNRDFGMGIFIRDSTDIIIRDNELFSGTLYGILATRSQQLHITENYIHDYSNSLIEFRSVNNSIISRNELENTKVYGVSIDERVTNLDDFNSIGNTIYHNSFTKTDNLLSASNALAYDNGTDNIWLNITLDEGNFWHDYSGDGSYKLDGDANAEDTAPLEEPVILFSDYDPDEGEVEFSFNIDGVAIIVINLIIYGLILYGLYRLVRWIIGLSKKDTDDVSASNSTHEVSKTSAVSCTNCGSELGADQKFCTICGTPRS